MPSSRLQFRIACWDSVALKILNFEFVSPYEYTQLDFSDLLLYEEEICFLKVQNDIQGNIYFTYHLSIKF